LWLNIPATQRNLEFLLFDDVLRHHDNVKPKPGGNIGMNMGSSDQKRCMRRKTIRENPMSRATLFGAIAILLTMTAAPAVAQSIIQRDTVGRTASAPLPPAKRGNETSTIPWSAPVGHRQPRADEVPAPTPLTQEALDKEDAIVDRKISNICRGC
jgi:hypothetical protein